MDFAKRELEKYGWKDGEGLGKSKTGISKPLKVTLKFDKGGLGHDEFDDNTNTWWKRLYDEAAKNIKAKTDSNDGVVLEVVDDSLEITTKQRKSNKNKNPPIHHVYKSFVKTSELHQNTELKTLQSEQLTKETQNESKRAKIDKTDCDISEVTDEELFRICGGRTAHKGARHGLKMSAKLARLEQQESLGLATFCTDITNPIKKKHKKKKKHECKNT